MKHQFLVVNGILTNPSDIDGWTDLFEDMYQNEGYACTKYEYFSGVLTRFMRQERRTQELAHIVKRINAPIVYVGHSNGCELFGRLMKDTDIKFEAAHLFAAAMDPDCNKNGITYGLLTKKVKNVYFYCSKNDRILKEFASKTSFLRCIGLGYGTLGYTGPKNILEQVKHRVDEHWDNKMDHCDWFNTKNFQKSIDLTFRK